MTQNRNQGGVQQNSGQQGSGQQQPPAKQGRGFAVMDQARQREIASKGGKAAHEKGTAHEFTSEEARIAGRKGGEVVSQNREHMAEIGREGGQARGHRNRNNQTNSEFGASSDESNRERGTSQQKRTIGEDMSSGTLSNDETLSDDENRKGRTGGQGSV